MEIKIEEDILKVNKEISDELNKIFSNKKIFVVNIMGSPGSGKTALLEATIEKLQKEFKIGVIEGDIETDLDKKRLSKFPIQIVQINTGRFDSECHLNAQMISDILPKLNLDKLDILFIENIGNLVCPAEFDIGEHKKIVVLSVTEGEDKPLKYPSMFRAIDLTIINKIDLLNHIDFDLELLKKNILKVNPRVKIITISAKEKKGINLWINWILKNQKNSS